MIITLCSASGSPGVSTSAMGLAMVWPRPVLLLEADPSGSSAMLTGYMRSFDPTSIPSIFDLALTYRQRGTLPPVWDAAVQVPESRIKLISGLRTHTQAAAVAGVWTPLIGQLHTLDAAGVDVIVDLGRLGLEGRPMGLLPASDLTLLVTRSSLPALVPAKNWAGVLGEQVGPGSLRAGLLVIGPGHPYSAADASKQLRLPVTTTLPMDPASADVFHLGSQPGRKFTRSPLHRSLAPAAAAIVNQIEEGKKILNGGDLR